MSERAVDIVRNAPVEVEDPHPHTAPPQGERYLSARLTIPGSAATGAGTNERRRQGPVPDRSDLFVEPDAWRKKLGRDAARNGVKVRMKNVGITTAGPSEYVVEERERKQKKRGGKARHKLSGTIGARSGIRCAVGGDGCREYPVRMRSGGAGNMLMCEHCAAMVGAGEPAVTMMPKVDVPLPSVDEKVFVTNGK